MASARARPQDGKNSVSSTALIGFVVQWFYRCFPLYPYRQTIGRRAVNQRVLWRQQGIAVFDFVACQKVTGFFQPLQDDGIRFPKRSCPDARRFADVSAFGVEQGLKLDAVFCCRTA